MISRTNSEIVAFRQPLGHGKGAAGKWTDAATGEHGDLLDLIAKARGLYRLCASTGHTFNGG